MSLLSLQTVRYNATLGEEGEHRFVMDFGRPIQTLADLRNTEISQAVIAINEGSPLATLIPGNLGKIGLQTELSYLDPAKVVKDLVGPEAQSTLVITSATCELMKLDPRKDEIDEFALCMMIGFPDHPLIATLEERK